MKRFRSSLVRCLIAFAASFLVSSASAGDLKVFFPSSHTGWLLQTPAGKVYVIDPGVAAEFYSAGKNGNGIGTYLKNNGIKVINGVVITHPHPDHYNAGERLFHDFKVLELIDSGFNPRTNAFGGYSAPFWKAFQSSGAKHTSGLFAGQTLTWDPAISVKVLGPKKPFWTFTEAGKDPERFYNQNSIVLFVQYGPMCYLFTGDITAPAQNYLRTSFPNEVQNTSILAIPHHGKYYFQKEFAQMVGATHPTVRIGMASRSHSKKGPAADRVPEWRKAGLTIYTGDNGNEITVTSTGRNTFKMETSFPPIVKTFSLSSK